MQLYVEVGWGHLWSNTNLRATKKQCLLPLPAPWGGVSITLSNSVLSTCRPFSGQNPLHTTHPRQCQSCIIASISQPVCPCPGTSLGTIELQLVTL